MENIKKILEANLVGTVATLNEDGSPWATPVHIFADNTALYWFSKAEQQHSQNIARDGRVSVALWARVDGTFGAYISGTAERLSAEKTAEILASDVVPMPATAPVFENTSAYRVEIGHINSSKSSEKRWYFYT